MALVKFGGGIIEMRGAIAGSVFSRNSSGNYVRAKTTPVNPNTARQVAIRANLALMTTRWSATLTAAQRTAWNLYASNVTVLNRLGEAVNISGFNHFIRSNVLLSLAGATIADDGPVVFEIPAQDPTLAITISEATQIITYTFDDTMAWCSEDDAYMHVFMGQPQNAQRNFFAGPWRRIGSLPGAAGVPMTSPQLLAVPFAVSEGQHIWAYARIQRADGRVSEAFEADTFCAA